MQVFQSGRNIEKMIGLLWHKSLASATALSARGFSEHTGSILAHTCVVGMCSCVCAYLWGLSRCHIHNAFWHLGLTLPSAEPNLSGFSHWLPDGDLARMWSHFANCSPTISPVCSYTKVFYHVCCRTKPLFVGSVFIIFLILLWHFEIKDYDQIPELCIPRYFMVIMSPKDFLGCK